MRRPAIPVAFGISFGPADWYATDRGEAVTSLGVLTAINYAMGRVTIYALAASHGPALGPNDEWSALVVACGLGTLAGGVHVLRCCKRQS